MMNKEFYKRKSCRLCGHEKLEDVIELTPTPPGNNFLSKTQLDKPESFYPLIVCFCLSCAHVQLSVVVNPEILYQDDYKFSYSDKMKAQEFLTSDIEKAQMMLDIIQGILVKQLLL